MSCFWDAIRKTLNTEDYKLLDAEKKSNKDLVLLLKKYNKICIDVKWNGKILKIQELEEHYKAIKEYNENKINNGHLTSICDSFLLLLASLFRVNIIHNYCGIEIKYEVNKERKTLKFKSNKGHFMFD